MDDARARVLEASLEVLLKFGTAEQAMVMVLDEDQNMVVKAAGFEGVSNLDQEISKLFQDLRKRPEAALLSRKRKGVMLSGVIAPLRDDCGNLEGFIYSECAASVGAFQFSDLRGIKDYAEELQEQLRDPVPISAPAVAPAPTSTAPTATESEKMKWLLVAVALLAVAWFGGLTVNWSVQGAGTKIEVVRTKKPTPDTKIQYQDPATAARFFLLLVRRGDFSAAYGLLSLARQSDFGTVEEFARLMKDWMAKAEPGDFSRVAVKKSDDRRRSRVEMRDQGEAGPAWDWQMVSEGGYWKLDRCREGPPVGLDENF